MDITPGVRIGRYQVVAPLGQGGMGEVYRATDETLGREVAIKLLRSDALGGQAERSRFELEAKALASLNHPNVLAAYDAGFYEGSPYLVTELLVGETLRQRLEGGRLPADKAGLLGAEIAHGLAAAHAVGLVHRDIKPANIFLTRDDRVKILDFGLARRHTPSTVDESADTRSALGPGTSPGTVLGTVGYMAPEQVRGLAADARADLFALGVVLYEMVSGRRAFARNTAVETMTAILSAEPEGLLDAQPGLPAGFQKIVARCLEKQPERRFQSAADLAFTLQELSGQPTARPVASHAAAPRGRRDWLKLTAAGLVGAGIGGVAGRSSVPARVPSFQRLTFRRGLIRSARLVPDGKTVLYGAAWDADPLRVYSTRLGSTESQPLVLPGADVLAVSPTGELALSLGVSRYGYEQRMCGTLARVNLAGGAPRSLLERVRAADWSPDGSELAVVHRTEGGSVLDFPVGRMLLKEEGWLSCVRVSPRGDAVALIESPRGTQMMGGSVITVDRRGTKRTLSQGWRTLVGLAWSPNGKEILFTGARSGVVQELYAVSLAGQERLVARLPGRALLHDVTPTRDVLFSINTLHTRLALRREGEPRERDLSWLDGSFASDLSPDGSLLLFNEAFEGAGSREAVYLRATTTTQAAVRLGEGFAIALSPDGRWAVAAPALPTDHLVLLPTGAGEIRHLQGLSFRTSDNVRWTPDSSRLVALAAEQGRPAQLFVLDVATGNARAISAESQGIRALMGISPDGRLACAVVDDRLTLVPLEGGAALTLDPERLSPEIRSSVRGWVIRRPGGGGPPPIRIGRLDVATGQETPWREIWPDDLTGPMNVEKTCVSADGRSIAYSYQRCLSDLYLAQGLL